MKHVMDRTVHNAYSALEAANRKLERGRMSADEARTLMDIADRAHATIDRHMRMDADDYSPYKNTRIGYDANARGRGRTSDDARDMMYAAMDLADRILPPLMDDDNVDNRRGVPGTGRRRVRRVRADRYDDRYDDDYDDDDMDDMRVYNMPRWRSARTGRFLPNLYGPRRVRRVRRRSDMDDRYDDRYDDDRYDDDRYDDARRTTDEARRTTDEARRAADDARRAADEARRIADDARNTNPVDRSDRARYDAARYDRTDARYDRRDDRTDDAHRPGPRV